MDPEPDRNDPSNAGNPVHVLVVPPWDQAVGVDLGSGKPFDCNFI